MRKDTQRVFDGVNGVKEGFFVFLVVFVVGQGLRFHEHQQAHQMAHHPSGFTTSEFGHVGVFLLRHDGAARGEAIRNLNEGKVLTHPQDQLFTHSADVHHQQATCAGELNGKVTVTDGVKAVLADLWLSQSVDHAQEFCHTKAIDGVTGARQGR